MRYILGFACQQQVFETFPSLGFLLFENGKVGVWYTATVYSFQNDSKEPWFCGNQTSYLNLDLGARIVRVGGSVEALLDRLK